MSLSVLFVGSIPGSFHHFNTNDLAQVNMNDLPSIWSLLHELGDCRVRSEEFFDVGMTLPKPYHAFVNCGDFSNSEQ